MQNTPNITIAIPMHGAMNVISEDATPMDQKSLGTARRPTYM